MAQNESKQPNLGRNHSLLREEVRLGQKIISKTFKKNVIAKITRLNKE